MTWSEISSLAEEKPEYLSSGHARPRLPFETTTVTWECTRIHHLQRPPVWRLLILQPPFDQWISCTTSMTLSRKWRSVVLGMVKTPMIITMKLGAPHVWHMCSDRQRLGPAQGKKSIQRIRFLSCFRGWKACTLLLIRDDFQFTAWQHVVLVVKPPLLPLLSPLVTGFLALGRWGLMDGFQSFWFVFFSLKYGIPSS